MPPEVTSPERVRDVDLVTLGVPVRLRCHGDDPDALARAVRRAWAAALAAPASPAVVIDVAVSADTETRVSSAAVTASSLEVVLHHVSTRVTLAAIEQQAGRLWMLHAAALADPATGRSVALVAPSGTGKSTASRVLGRRFGYVTDETTAIAPDLRIHPHPKPLSIIQQGTDIKAQVAPGDAGLLPAPAAPTLAAIVLLRRDGTHQVDIEPLRTSVALAALAPETSYLARLPRPLAFMAGIIEQTAGVVEAHYAEAADLEPVVAELLAC